MEPNDPKLLEKFVTEGAKMRSVFCNYLNGKGIPNEEDLINYHPAIGKGYSVDCAIAEEMNNLYLKIIPNGGAWGDLRKEFLKNLLFCPMPNLDLQGRPPALYLSKKIVGDDNKNQLGDTGWRIAHARISKFILDGDEVNDVIFTWRHDAWEDYLVTCWKW